MALTAALSSSVFLLMKHKEVRFLNLRAANLIELRQAKIPGELILSKETPLMIVSEKGVAVGELRNILAPTLPGSALIMSPSEWKEVEKTGKSSALMDKFENKFPIRTVLVSSQRADLQELHGISRVFARINKDKGFAVTPSLMMAFPPSQIPSSSDTLKKKE